MQHITRMTIANCHSWYEWSAEQVLRRIALKSLARITPLCFLVTGVLADSVCVGSNPTTQMSLLTPHVLAQKSSAPAQDRQKNADAFLRQARQAMKQGNLEAAASYLKRAEALEPEYDPVWNGLKDTPAQVRKDLARLQAASDTTLPSRQFNAQQPQTTRTGSDRIILFPSRSGKNGFRN